MTELEQKWNELKSVFNEYLEVICQDHHKNRDGELYLQRYYNGWGEADSGWEVVHDGYVNDFRTEGSTPIEAVERAIEEIKKLTVKELEWIKQLKVEG